MTEHQIYTLNNTTAVKLTPGLVHSGFDITIQNTSTTGYVYVGGEEVSPSSYGYRILPNHAISFELPPKDHLYIVAATSGMTAAVIKTGLEHKN